MKLWIDFPKSCSPFPKNFLVFWLDTIEKHIINLGSYSSNSYASVVVSDSEVAFLGDKENAVLCLFIVFCLYKALHNRRSTSSDKLVFHNSGHISVRLAAFLILVILRCRFFGRGRMQLFVDFSIVFC